MYETIAWVGILIVSRSWTVLPVVIIGVAQMLGSEEREVLQR